MRQFPRPAFDWRHLPIYRMNRLILFLWTPVLTKVTLEFHLDFQGVEHDKYPNGTDFSIQEILSVPVLSSVYEANELQSHLSLQEFFDSVFVSDESDSVELLDAEYRGKLADSKLNTVDRLRIEEEFRSKRKALKSADYSLNFLCEQGLVRMPTSQIGKVLSDILATWADFADERKGVLRYKISPYSQNFVRTDFLKSEDYIVAVDLLRSKIKLAQENMRRIAELPGAEVIRVGEEKISLAEVRLSLEDTLRLRVEPLLVQLRAGGVSKDPEAALNYFKTRLYDVKLRREDKERRIQTLREALNQYLLETRFSDRSSSGESAGRRTLDASTPAMIPQFGSSFLDRLLELSGERNDAKFRQNMTERIVGFGMEKATLDQERAYYEDMMEGITRLRKLRVGEKTLEFVESRTALIVSELLKALEQLGAIHTELSAHNLNPRTSLYGVSSAPLVSSQRSLSLKYLLLSGIAFSILTLVLTILVCLIHDALRGDRSDTLKVRAGVG